MKRNFYFSLFLCFVPFVSLSAQVKVDKTENEVTIGNEYLSRTFKIEGQSLVPGTLINKRTDGGNTIFMPSTGSEEFSLRIVNKTQMYPNPVVRTNWTVTTDSWCNDNAKSGPANFAIDGDETTIWHTNYRGTSGTGPEELPHWLLFDMKVEHTLKSFGYVPRLDGGDNGKIKGYELYVSDDVSKIDEPGSLAAKGEFVLEGSDPVWINLVSPVIGRYVKLKEITSQNGQKFGSCAEFYVSQDTFIEPKALIKASDMTIKNVLVSDIEDGKRITFDMEPYQLGDVNWDIDMVVEMKDMDHFMHKYLQISTPMEQREKARIDYIDMEDLGTATVPETNKWSHPEMGGGVGGMSGYTIALGQPVYIDGLFFGSEFPQTENDISENMAHIRYYSGKSLEELAAENRLSNGYFTTWKNVVGAARSATDWDVVRSDFFAYINSIATPTDLRLQYNSWYDFMMDINETNILASFKEMERGFTQYGVRPLDCYVVDDGWNAYGPWQSDNTMGFWQFNSKFPNGLAKPSLYSHQIASNFGLWLGPRGGYNYPGAFAQFLQAQGNGTYSNTSGDIVTGDKQYLKKLQEFFLDNQKEYAINYWKLDGFQTAAPQPSNNGRYITGGKNGMYYFTEHWERWYNVLTAIREDAKSRNSNYWINLTCYVNPSPWLLQWGNSVWMQNSTDIGRNNAGNLGTQNDQLLSYRDGRYFDFNRVRQFQFPFSNIYNHDPIYGKTGGVSPNGMNDEQFRSYLYMMSTRGNAFWELYYSYTMLDEGNKWMINAEFLKYLQENYDILRHSKLIGATPENGNVYGYSCWNDKEGIVSIRNPKNANQTFKITLNRTIGVPENATNLWRSLIMKYNTTSDDDNTVPFKYGDDITISLKPGEVRIWKFSPEKDVTPADFVVAGASTSSARSVTVDFTEPIKSPETANFKLYCGDEEYADAGFVKLLANNRSVTIDFSRDMDEAKTYRVKATNVSDWNNNMCNAFSPDFYFNKNAVVIRIDFAGQLKDRTGVEESVETSIMANMIKLRESHPVKSQKAILGRGDFNVSFYLSTTALSAKLVNQVGAFEITLDGGKPKFTVGGLTVKGDTVVNDGKPHYISCCREKNGMIKIYKDGHLQTSSYNAQIINESLVTGQFVLGGSGSEIELGEVELRSTAMSYKQNMEAITGRVIRYPIAVHAQGKAVLLKNSGVSVIIPDDGIYKANIKRGKNCSISLSPASGYVITDWLVDGVSQGSLNFGEWGSYNFVNVQASHTLVINSSIDVSVNDVQDRIKITTSPKQIHITGLNRSSTLSVVSASGIMMIEMKTLSSSSVMIPCAHWPKGVYLVKIQKDDKTTVFNIVR